MLTQNVKMILSPFNANVEVVGPMVFNVMPPYDEKSLILNINPNITDYEDKPKTSDGVQVRQAMATESTDETQNVSFNLEADNEKVINFRGINYKIKLLNIGKESLEGQDFPFFEFFVEEQE